VVALVGFVFPLTQEGVSYADPLYNWSTRTSGTPNDLNGVTYCNGTFIAVGSSGTILTSLDGVIWSAMSSGISNNLNGVTFGSGIFVAVGDSGTILTSTDLATWTKKPAGTSEKLYSVAYGNDTFVAVGSSGTILTSTDSATWTKKPAGTSNWLLGVIYANNKFVAVSNWGNILFSPDGATWTNVSSGTSQALSGVAYGNGTFVAGDFATIVTSSDGLLWTERIPETNKWIFGVSYATGTFVAVGADGAIFSSPDGVYWTGRLSGTSDWLYGITYGNGTFVAVGSDGTILQSDPLITNCDATLTTDFKLNIPVLSFDGNYYQVGFQYSPSSDGFIWLILTNAAQTTQSGCGNPATLVLSYDKYIFHIPSLNFSGTSYWLDLEYVPTTDGFIWVKLTNYGTKEIDYRQEMREFAQGISAYAKGFNPDFIIIPQNGQELLTENGEANGPLSHSYLEAIDGIGREDLFYGYNEDNVATPDSERNYLLGFMDLAEKNGVEVLVTDYCWTPSFVDDSYSKSYSKGYISFAADHRELDNIPTYPASPYNTNSQNISSLGEAKNFLYLINPNYPTKADFLNAMRNTDYDILIIDLFYNSEALTPDDIASLKVKKNGGTRLVISYMSIGEAENYRYYWKEEWEINPPPWLEKENPNWPSNYKVRYWYEDWQNIIYGNNDSYLKKIIDAGFDGVYLDIIDAFEYFESK